MDQGEVKTYKPQKSLMGAGFIGLGIIFVLTVSTLSSGTPIDRGELIGLGCFWLIGILLIVLPFGFKLKIGNDHVSTYFLGFRIRTLHASNIQSLKYANLFGLGGLGAGKGLRIWEKSPRGRRYTSIGESIYGKDAIEHAKRVLERNL